LQRPPRTRREGRRHRGGASAQHRQRGLAATIATAACLDVHSEAQACRHGRLTATGGHAHGPRDACSVQASPGRRAARRITCRRLGPRLVCLAYAPKALCEPSSTGCLPTRAWAQMHAPRLSSIFWATLSIQRTTVTEYQACLCTAAQPHLAFGHASLMSRLLASRNHIHSASRNDVHLQRLPLAPMLAPGVARAQGLHGGALVPCSSGKAPLQTL
jgi:hypothetical protein